MDSVPFFMGYLLTPRAASEFQIAYSLDEMERYEITLDETRWKIQVRVAEAELRVQKCPVEK